MLFGLSIGLAVALVVYLQSGPSRVPGLARETATLTEPADRPIAQPESNPPETIATPADSPETPLDQPDEIGFSFPYLLEDSVVVVAESEFDFGLGADSAPDVVIQAGSFPTARGADSRRADVALLGFESFIEPAMVQGERFHRVIIGPLSDRGEINRTLRRLQNAEIETVLRPLLTD